MKRFFDILLSLLAIIIISPLLLIICIAILIDDGSPVMFFQDRIGKGGKIFKIQKFRTMHVGTPNVASGELENVQDYYTKTGKFLRKTSLDEIPQLFNVLKGEMSLVGPRPLVPSETPMHELRNKYNIYSLRPGVTGWAQVNGRDKLTPKEKVAFDKEYLERRSIPFDFYIMLRTVVVVLKRDGIAEGKQEAADKGGSGKKSDNNE